MINLIGSFYLVKRALKKRGGKLSTLDEDDALTVINKFLDSASTLTESERDDYRIRDVLKRALTMYMQCHGARMKSAATDSSRNQNLFTWNMNKARNHFACAEVTKNIPLSIYNKRCFIIGMPLSLY